MYKVEQDSVETDCVTFETLTKLVLSLQYQKGR